MRSRLQRYRAPVAVMAAAALVALGPGTASADPSSPDDLVGRLHEVAPGQSGPASAPDEVDSASGAPSSTEPSSTTPSSTGPGARSSSRSATSSPATTADPATTASSDDDQPGHETKNPARPDHGAAEVADLDAGGQDVADVGHNNATVHNDDSTRADSTLLALGGEEIAGSHADSDGAKQSHFGDPLAPLCQGSDGAVCLRVLYADAYATDNGSTSHSQSKSGVAQVCVGGDSSSRAADCTAPVGVGVATSRGEASRNQSSGRTTASSESDVADVCLQPDAKTGSCALGAAAVHSQGHSDSARKAGRDSYLVGLDAGGGTVARMDQPTSVAVQPSCTEPSLVCAYLNQGETYVGDRIGHAQDALSLQVLPGTPLEINLGLGATESLVHNDGGNGAGSGSSVGGDSPGGSNGTNDGLSSGGPGVPGATAGGGALANDSTGLLPNTGGIWSGLLALGLLSVAGGAFTLAYSRRRVAAVV